MAGWHHWLDGHGFGWTLGVGDGQGCLGCWGSRGHKLNWTERKEENQLLLFPQYQVVDAQEPDLRELFLIYISIWDNPYSTICCKVFLSVHTWIHTYIYIYICLNYTSYFWLKTQITVSNTIVGLFKFLLYLFSNILVIF